MDLRFNAILSDNGSLGEWTLEEDAMVLAKYNDWAKQVGLPPGFQCCNHNRQMQGEFLIRIFHTWSDLPPDTTRISWLAVRVARGPGSPEMAVEFHTFLTLTMDSSFIAHRVHREGANRSIFVGTLLALLCQSLFVGDGVPVNLANILSGVSRDHDEHIMVATSQVPLFNWDFQNPT